MAPSATSEAATPFARSGPAGCCSLDDIYSLRGRQTEPVTLLSAGRRVSRRLEKEPDPTLGLIDPVFEKACRRHVAMLVAKIMDFAHGANQLYIVVPEFGEH